MIKSIASVASARRRPAEQLSKNRRKNNFLVRFYRDLYSARHGPNEWTSQSTKLSLCQSLGKPFFLQAEYGKHGNLEFLRLLKSKTCKFPSFFKGGRIGTEKLALRWKTSLILTQLDFYAECDLCRRQNRPPPESLFNAF